MISKVVVLGGNIDPTQLSNALSPATAPNANNVGTHWIMLPDRGVCVGDASLATQNDGSYIKYTQSGGCVGGCFSNPGAPVFANPPSQFKKEQQKQKQQQQQQQQRGDTPVNGADLSWLGASFGSN
jgi:hypothetical protein